jgi:hypothetical protein
MPLCLVGSCTDQSIADRLGVGLPIKCFHLNVWHTSLSLSTVPATARAGPQCALYAKEPHTWSTSVRFLAADAVALGWRCGRVSPLHSIICKPSMRQNSLAECGRRSSASPKLKCEFMSVLQRKHCSHMPSVFIDRCVCVCVCVCVCTSCCACFALHLAAFFFCLRSSYRLRIASTSSCVGIPAAGDWLAASACAVWGVWLCACEYVWKCGLLFSYGDDACDAMSQLQRNSNEQARTDR